MLRFPQLLFLLLFNDVGNFAAGAIFFNIDPHAADFRELVSVGIHFGRNLGFVFLEINKVFDLNGFDPHFLLTNQNLGDQFFGGGKVNFGHDSFYFFKALCDAPDGVVFELLEIQEENGCFVFLAETIDFDKLIFAFIEWVFDDLMVFGFVSIDGVEFVEVIKVHFDEIAKFVAVHFKEWVSSVDGLIQRVDYFLLSVVAHDNDF